MKSREFRDAGLWDWYELQVMAGNWCDEERHILFRRSLRFHIWSGAITRITHSGSARVTLLMVKSITHEEPSKDNDNFMPDSLRIQYFKFPYWEKLETETLSGYRNSIVDFKERHYTTYLK